MRSTTLVGAAIGLVLGALLVAAAGASRSPRATTACGPYGDVPREGSPVASADGHTLAWVRWTWRNQRTRVFVSAVDGSAPRPVSVPAGPSDYPSALAPDGSQVLVRREGDAPRFILASTTRPESRYVSAAEAREISHRWRSPEWSPDGKFEVATDFEGVWVVPAAGGARDRVSPTLLNHGAAWSPDGSLIAFASGDGMTSADSDLYVVRPDGTGRRRLTKRGNAWNPSWSPDGALLAFDADSSSYHEGSAIGLIRPDGSGLRLLTRPGQGPDQREAIAVSWVDASTLVFVSYQHGRDGPHKVVDVHTIGVDGRGERRVTYQCHLGTRKDDLLPGSILADTMRAFAGDDELRPGPGIDVVEAGAGDDLVRARDGARDVVRCGTGRDRVLADDADVVGAGCESVARR